VQKGYVCSFLAVAGIPFADVAAAKCAHFSARRFFTESETVVLVSIVQARSGPVPYGLKAADSIPGWLLRLRVVKSWKGSLRPEEIIDGWTPTLRVEDAYPRTEVGTQIIAFFGKKFPHEIMACNTARPDDLDAVSNELDGIVQHTSTRRAP
jgi:hypothetical protein